MKKTGYSGIYEAVKHIPYGKVATYGQVAEAAGYPRGHRLVTRFLSDMHYSDLPWHRVIGAGGQIKIPGRGGAKQRSLLKAEGVACVGKRIDMEQYAHTFE